MFVGDTMDKLYVNVTNFSEWLSMAKLPCKVILSDATCDVYTIEDQVHLLSTRFAYDSDVEKSINLFNEFLTEYIINSINKLIEDGLIELIEKDQIRVNPVKYQMAMDFCGCWYDGYEIPININVVKLTDYGKQLIENNGSNNVSNYLTEQFLLENSGIVNQEEITDV